MKQFEYTNDEVKSVSYYLQYYMHKYNMRHLTADQAATILNHIDVLSNNKGPKPGFNFREMLRQGKKDIINMVTGAWQKKKNSTWYIFRVDDYENLQ